MSIELFNSQQNKAASGRMSSPPRRQVRGTKASELRRSRAVDHKPSLSPSSSVMSLDLSRTPTPFDLGPLQSKKLRVLGEQRLPDGRKLPPPALNGCGRLRKWGMSPKKGSVQTPSSKMFSPQLPRHMRPFDSWEARMSPSASSPSLFGGIGAGFGAGFGGRLSHTAGADAASSRSGINGPAFSPGAGLDAALSGPESDGRILQEGIVLVSKLDGYKGHLEDAPPQGHMQRNGRILCKRQPGASFLVLQPGPPPIAGDYDLMGGSEILDNVSDSGGSAHGDSAFDNMLQQVDAAAEHFEDAAGGGVGDGGNGVGPSSDDPTGLGEMRDYGGGHTAHSSTVDLMADDDEDVDDHIPEDPEPVIEPEEPQPEPEPELDQVPEDEPEVEKEPEPESEPVPEPEPEAQPEVEQEPEPLPQTVFDKLDLEQDSEKEQLQRRLSQKRRSGFSMAISMRPEDQWHQNKSQVTDESGESDEEEINIPSASAPTLA